MGIFPRFIFAIAMIVGFISLAGCGTAVCVAGIGNCDVYKNWNTSSPTSGNRPTYSLKTDNTTVGFNTPIVLQLTTNAINPAAAQCTWDIPSGGGGISPDAQPAVRGALCTATFTSPAVAGQSTVRVNDRTSGNIVQIVITTAPAP